MREKVIKLKIMNKNKRHIGLKMSSVETRTAHSRDRCEIKKSIFSTLPTGPAPARRYSGVNSNIGKVLVCNFVK